MLKWIGATSVTLLLLSGCGGEGTTAPPGPIDGGGMAPASAEAVEYELSFTNLTRELARVDQ